MRFLRNAALLLFVIAICAGASETPVNTSETNDAETVTLPLDGTSSMPLTQLLDFASEILGFPILYDACEMPSCTYHFTSSVTMPRSEFQGYFERLIVEKGFVYLESGAGDSAIRWVTNLNNRKNSRPGDMTLFVPAGDLERYSGRGILVTTSIPIKHVSAREIFQSLSSMIQQGGLNIESIRAVENANTVVITTYSSKAWQIYRLVQALDIKPTYERTNSRGAISQLQAKVAKLEKRLEALEKK